MGTQEKLDIDMFKVVSRAISESTNLDIMANHLAQLLTAALGIKGCTIFALNLETEELEVLASFGLSVEYMNKGPVTAEKSIGCTLKGEAVVVNDVTSSDRLQYPEEAVKEGVGAMVSLPIMFLKEAIGVLRLYHHDVWDISDRDVDSLLILAENIGLAMMYTRLLNTLQAINEAMSVLPTELVPLFGK